MEAEILSIVGNYGFPIALCFWFMFRTEKIIKENTDAILSLREVINRRN